ncbi:hypothetical protein IE81DRAFT_292060 [Ceraceosorus guamensis]|uniref:Tyrosine specific protein phosphatases domain-containing protein n=1 Tax=Ceraceosorus guamensis TaxID=1522189 RepID=A0A316VWJ3_9BASI|nr:hypothetical protein IE81DRAFT_292060 [Ceraceosorus guamensis]PWN41318.1 hypothetical protein IE81DRAFT_292060 [Ceraceosorus guamensis]
MATLLQSASQFGVRALDHLFLALHATPESSAVVAERMIVDFPHSFRGFLRMAAAYEASNPKVACLALAQACKTNAELVPKVAKRLGTLRNQVSYGPTVTLEELESIPLPIRDQLLGSWPAQLDEVMSSTLWTACTQSRNRSHFGTYGIPRFFSWVYPGRIAGMSTPRNAQDIDALVDMGFDHVLSLAAESPLDPAWFRFKAIKHVFVPLENYGHPTLEEMDSILELIEQSGTWLIHCGGGVGRAGTILACLISIFGRGDEEKMGYPLLDAGAAISLLRSMRPRSLESESQERFVSAYVSHRWRCAGATKLPEPMSSLRVERSLSSKAPLDDLSVPTIIVMVGLPGSGKSWLAAAIAKRRGDTEIISQDTDGRAACERSMGMKQRDGVLVILDRCNPRQDDRSSWLALMISTRRKIAVFFDIDAALCKQRMDRRLGHPIIRAGRGYNALDQMQRDMRLPSLSEGFDALLTVTSMHAAKEALRVLSPSPKLLKFPRTPHLFNTGAATHDDLTCEDIGSSITGNIVVEEKIDGANLGLSLDADGIIRCQNRSHWISSADHKQFKPLDGWIEAHRDAVYKLLARDSQFLERFILYGEWMVAKHSVYYDRLPSHFVAFDLYDRLTQRFCSRSALATALRGTAIAHVPLVLQTSHVTRERLLSLCQEQSLFSTERREGVYLRFEDDEHRYTIKRAKVVRSDFIAGNEHWSKSIFTPNVIADGHVVEAGDR